jgi:hypothetical protein
MPSGVWVMPCRAPVLAIQEAVAANAARRLGHCRALRYVLDPPGLYPLLEGSDLSSMTPGTGLYTSLAQQRAEPEFSTCTWHHAHKFHNLHQPVQTVCCWCSLQLCQSWWRLSTPHPRPDMLPVFWRPLWQFAFRQSALQAYLCEDLRVHSQPLANCQ